MMTPKNSSKLTNQARKDVGHLAKEVSEVSFIVHCNLDLKSVKLFSKVLCTFEQTFYISNVVNQ